MCSFVTWHDFNSSVNQKSLTNIKMGKITCVGQMWSFIHYRLGNQGLQKKAASVSPDQRGGARRGQAPARNLTANTELSDLPKRALDLQQGNFQKVRPAHLLGVLWGPLFQLLTPLKAEQPHPQQQPLCSTDTRHSYGTQVPPRGNSRSVGWDTAISSEYAIWEKIPPCIQFQEIDVGDPKLSDLPIWRGHLSRRATAYGHTLLSPSWISKPMLEARDGHLPMKYLHPPHPSAGKA